MEYIRIKDVDRTIIDYLSMSFNEDDNEIKKKICNIFSEYPSKIYEDDMTLSDYDTFMTFLMGVATVIVGDKKHKALFIETLETVKKINSYIED